MSVSVDTKCTFRQERSRLKRGLNLLTGAVKVNVSATAILDDVDAMIPKALSGEYIIETEAPPKPVPVWKNSLTLKKESTSRHGRAPANDVFYLRNEGPARDDGHGTTKSISLSHVYAGSRLRRSRGRLG